MDPPLRALFNRGYSDDLYLRVCAEMDRRLETREFGFRLAETPLFLPAGLRRRCEEVSGEILAIIRRPEVVAACRAAVPERYDAPDVDELPHFVAIDLAIVQGEDGDLEPRLIELQGFASLYGMQLVQGKIWGEAVSTIPGMPRRWTNLFSGLDERSYLDLLRRTIIAGADPDEVILLDLDPSTQKTRPDFHATARFLGVRAVCVSELRREGRRLLAPKDGRWLPVRRVLHRVVFDELERRGVRMCFDYRERLDLTWVAHPNWYWIWSKYTLPFLQHPAVPRTVRLDQAGTLPADLDRYVLKPVFSFAGQGVRVDVDRAGAEAIPPAERSRWLLQEKVDYAPALVAPDGSGVKAEVRMMYLRPEGTRDLVLAVNLTRLSRGKMHGVDHNKGMRWVGSSVAIWPEGTG
jgi:hypothetical protein